MYNPMEVLGVYQYNRKQYAFNGVKQRYDDCPKCGDEEVYYENPRTGNGLYNCDSCGYSAHERKFTRPRFKIRKCILRRWHKK